mmetsp:Transcript_8638/g.17955  ORF Transcript_8638/g.17955 Transcript_8638/m.17955 type:complete len:312 (-) Transcript_8638:1124-2059(-)
MNATATSSIETASSPSWKWRGLTATTAATIPSLMMTRFLHHGATDGCTTFHDTSGSFPVITAPLVARMCMLLLMLWVEVATTATASVATTAAAESASVPLWIGMRQDIAAAITTVVVVIIDVTTATPPTLKRRSHIPMGETTPSSCTSSGTTRRHGRWRRRRRRRQRNAAGNESRPHTHTHTHGGRRRRGRRRGGHDGTGDGGSSSGGSEDVACWGSSAFCWIIISVGLVGIDIVGIVTMNSGRGSRTSSGVIVIHGIIIWIRNCICMRCCVSRDDGVFGLLGTIISVIGLVRSSNIVTVANAAVASYTFV